MNFPSILSLPHFCWLGPCHPFRGAADRSRQEPTGADRSRQEPTGADRISVGLARVTLEAAAWCLVAGSAAAGSSDPHPGWAGRRKPAETS